MTRLGFLKFSVMFSVGRPSQWAATDVQRPEMNRSRSLFFKTYLILKIGSVTKKLQLLKDGNKIEKSGKSKDVHEFLQGNRKMFVQICYYRFSILRYLRVELILFTYKDLLDQTRGDTPSRQLGFVVHTGTSPTLSIADPNAKCQLITSPYRRPNADLLL